MSNISQLHNILQRDLVTEILIRLTQETDRVFSGGLSMGGNLGSPGYHYCMLLRNTKDLFHFFKDLF